jgi:hypothetical protein
MFHNFQTAASGADAVRRYTRLNLVLIPGFNMNIGIVHLDAQLRLAAQFVGFRPIVRVSEACEGEDSNRQRQGNFAHEGSSPRFGHTSIQADQT